MSGIARVGDMSSGHDFCPGVPIVSGSSNVFVDGKPVACVGDTCSPHYHYISEENQHPLHTPVIITGSNNVFVNGRPVAKIGSIVSCSPFGEGMVVEGSSTVFVGG